MTITAPRPYFREPIGAIFRAQEELDSAITAHLAGDKALAAALIRSADKDEIRAWTESIWGRSKCWGKTCRIEGAPPVIPASQRDPLREASEEMEEALLERDGFHCRFCGIPVIREKVRKAIQKLYPDALRWKRGNINQHAGFQAMWVVYDHILPHSRGGRTDMDNLVIACWPCNGGRMERTLEEVNLMNPRTRHPVRSDWDGLERIPT